MANIPSQRKRNRQNEKRRVANQAVRTELKTRIKGAGVAAEAGDSDAAEKLRTAQKRMGKAQAKGVVHKNQAARRTSRMMRRANKAAGVGPDQG